MSYYRNYRKPYYRRNYVRRNNSSDVLVETLVSIVASLGVIIGTLIFKLFRKIFNNRNNIRGSFKINDKSGEVVFTEKQIVPDTEKLSEHKEITTEPERVLIKNEKYRLKESLLTETEEDFLKVLKQVVGDTYYVESQVQLSSIIRPTDSNYHYTNYTDFNKIKAKSIDFVLFEKGYKPYLAIELDDRSHFRWKRMVRDQFVNELMQSVGLRIIHVPVSYNYDVGKLKEQIFIK